MVRKYKVAENIFEVTIENLTPTWQALDWHYQPFEVEDGTPLFSVRLRSGRVDIPNDFEQVYDEQPANQGDIGLRAFRNAAGDYLFAITYAGDCEPSAWLSINSKMNEAVATVDESSHSHEPLKVENLLTSLMQLSYHLATNSESTLVTHTSCVVKDGRAYLFQGKSGTGKSTHTRLWVENIAGAEIMNDDHPVLRVFDDGRVVAYGSPWSGKTHYYKNVSAPAGAMVRIVRAPHNALRRLSPLQAYASVTSTIFKLPFDAAMSERRHATIEQVIMRVPCYEMECRPNAEAARCCFDGLT